MNLLGYYALLLYGKELCKDSSKTSTFPFHWKKQTKNKHNIQVWKIMS